jgi:hypothetical protein
MKNTEHQYDGNELNALMRDWKKRIDEVTAAIAELHESSTEEQRAWKPRADVWSFDEVLEHVMAVNDSFVPVIRNLEAGTYRPIFVTRFRRYARFVGSLILKSLEPENTSKTKTVRGWEPCSREPRSDLMQLFAIHQSKLKDLITISEPHLQRDIVISSPENRYITYTLRSAFDIIVLHEQRHLLQARRVLQQLNRSR